jgi:hypothetical protein
MMHLIGKEDVDGRHTAGHDDEGVATVTSRVCGKAPWPGSRAEPSRFPVQAAALT